MHNNLVSLMDIDTLLHGLADACAVEGVVAGTGITGRRHGNVAGRQRARLPHRPHSERPLHLAVVLLWNENVGPEVHYLQQRAKRRRLKPDA